MQIYLLFLLHQKQKKKSTHKKKTKICTVQCTRNEDCSLAEACFDGSCLHPCNVRNPCATNAVCVNVNHGTDCSCAEGYEGNAYAVCKPGKQNYRVGALYSIQLVRF